MFVFTGSSLSWAQVQVSTAFSGWWFWSHFCFQRFAELCSALQLSAVCATRGPGQRPCCSLFLSVGSLLRVRPMHAKLGGEPLVQNQLHLLTFLSSPPRVYFSFPGGPPFGFWPESWDVIYSVPPEASCDYTCSQGQETGGQQEEKLTGLCFILLGLVRKHPWSLRSFRLLLSLPRQQDCQGLEGKETEETHTQRFPHFVVVGAPFPTAQARQRLPLAPPLSLPVAHLRPQAA